ncbi:MAG: RND family efflux transporter MFP subunit [bacterium]|nr:MAG: RND family efflux transporter MFP subunit [bacterium]
MDNETTKDNVINNIAGQETSPLSGNTTNLVNNQPSNTNRSSGQFIAIIILTMALVIVSVLLIRSYQKPASQTVAGEKEEHGEHKDEHGGEGSSSSEVELSPEVLASLKLETALVKEETHNSTFKVTGTIEANQQYLQQASALVSGRIEKVNYVLGDKVQAGAILALIASPQIAQLHGKLHESETRLALAERHLQRVEKAENRVSVISAKAKLDESETNLRRVKKLIELGGGAGKDLVAAETSYLTAKAEYEFQNSIALNREVQEALAEAETAKVDVAHIRDELKAFGAPVAKGEDSEHDSNTSLIPLIAPISGNILERLVNAGAGIEVGKPLFTIANLSTLWVIANVPESQIHQLKAGNTTQVYSPVLGQDSLSGKITYIDPVLNEDTRTAKVRIEINNPDNKLKVGMFVEVALQTETSSNLESKKSLLIPEEAIQRIGERIVVFIPQEKEEGHFEVREVQLGGENNGLREIVAGLSANEKVVTTGSFTLKTQMMKGELGEHD